MEREKLVSGLRQAAEFFEQHENVPLPDEAEIKVFRISNREDLVPIVRTLGNCEKKQIPEYDLFEVCKEFGPVKIRFIAGLSHVCTRIVKETKHVAEKRIPETIIPSHDVEVVEWDCSAPLLDSNQAANS